MEKKEGGQRVEKEDSEWRRNKEDSEWRRKKEDSRWRRNSDIPCSIISVSLCMTSSLTVATFTHSNVTEVRQSAAMASSAQCLINAVWPLSLSVE